LKCEKLSSTTPVLVADRGMVRGGLVSARHGLGGLLWLQCCGRTGQWPFSGLTLLVNVY